MKASDFTTGGNDREKAMSNLLKTEKTDAVNTGLVEKADKSAKALKGDLYSVGKKGTHGAGSTALDAIARKRKKTSAADALDGKSRSQLTGKNALTKKVQSRHNLNKSLKRGAKGVAAKAAHNALKDSELEGTDDLVATTHTGAKLAGKARKHLRSGKDALEKKDSLGALSEKKYRTEKLDKKAAKENYYKHLKGKKYLPKVFKKENHVDEIKGVYIPFWLFDVDADAQITYEAEKVHSHTSGDTEYTTREIYSVYREGSLSFDHVPADGSRKMDDTLMEAIEPYNFQEAVPFQQAYLAGYLADRYDVNVDERIDRARDRIRVCTERAFRKTVRGYNGGASVKDSNVQIHNASYWYAMYPVWLLNTTWHGQKFTFAMNGQTGKMVGDLPIDKSKFWKSVGIRTVLIWGVLYGLKCLFLM